MSQEIKVYLIEIHANNMLENLRKKTLKTMNKKLKQLSKLEEHQKYIDKLQNSRFTAVK